MNWEAFGAVAEFLGAAAVLGTIGYLAIQIKQAGRIAATAFVTNIHQQYNELNRLLVSDAALRRVLLKRDDLEPEESEQVYAFANMCINNWISIQTAYDNGQMEDAVFAGIRNDVRAALDRWPGFYDALARFFAAYPEVEDYAIFREFRDRAASQ